MPKSTFNNLPANKRKLVQNICLEEFSSHSFAEASVSRMVKALGIAKGSIYQYFKDKFDLYTYLIQISLDRKYKILDFVAQRSIQSLDFWLLQVCLAELKFAKEFSEMQALLVRADLESDYPIEERDNSFIEIGFKRLILFMFSRDLEAKVFLVRIFKNGIVAKFMDSALTDEVVNSQINPLVRLVDKIVTNQS